MKAAIAVAVELKFESIFLDYFCSKNGGAGESELRTHFGIQLIFGMPLPQYKLPPFVASPFKFTWKSGIPAKEPQSLKTDKGGALRHPICTVFDWQKRLTEKKGLTKVQIAKDQGLTRARISQMFRLLDLPKEAQEHLAVLEFPSYIKVFSGRRLQSIVKLPLESRGKAFAEMRANCERLF